MTRFDPAKTYTIGEFYADAMIVTTKEEADSILADMVAYHAARFKRTPEESRSAVLEDIGYFTGYYDEETAGRVCRLFGTTHPLFGDTRPSPEEAFEMGLKMGEAAKEAEHA